MNDEVERRRRKLRSVIVLGADPGSPVNYRERLLARLVGELDELQVQLLDFLSAPGSWFQVRGQRFPFDTFGGVDAVGDPTHSIRTKLKAAFPAYGSEDALLDIAIHDLNARGLISIDTIDTHCQPVPGYASAMGRGLLEFVRASDR